MNIDTSPSAQTLRGMLCQGDGEEEDGDMATVRRPRASGDP